MMAQQLFRPCYHSHYILKENIPFVRNVSCVLLYLMWMRQMVGRSNVAFLLACLEPRGLVGTCEFGGTDSRIHGERESYKPEDVH